MNRIIFLIAVLLTAGTVQAAQLYRWVDDKGRVEWRDTPPPASAKKVERRTVGDSVIETTGLPYSVQQAVKNFPLTLYTTDCGDSCSKARAHLNRRGLPFTEKNPEADIEGYKKLTGGLGVPTLFVGRESLKGYQEDAWDTALDNAGYPRSVAGARPAAPKPAATPAPGKPPAAAPTPTPSVPSPTASPSPTTNGPFWSPQSPAGMPSRAPRSTPPSPSRPVRPRPLPHDRPPPALAGKKPIGIFVR